MAYRATVIPVMIASPGDVSEERAIVREVLHEWNDVNGAVSRVLLLPVGWESHSSPELGSRPQEIINTRLLRDCDLLIGVFWTRLGTPTGRAPSGTVEEIQEHVNAGKPAMIYFSDQPVAPASIDSEQYAQVEEFKNQCQSMGLIEHYDNIQEFRSKLTRQLSITMSQNEFLRQQTTAVAEAPTVTARVEEGPKVALSADAIELLKAAVDSKEKDGFIINRSYVGGHHVDAGAKKFGGSYGREQARWERALHELVQKQLIIDRRGTNELYELTHLGWQVGDEL